MIMRRNSLISVSPQAHIARKRGASPPASRTFSFKSRVVCVFVSFTSERNFPPLYTYSVLFDPRCSTSSLACTPFPDPAFPMKITVRGSFLFIFPDSELCFNFFHQFKHH